MINPEKGATALNRSATIQVLIIDDHAMFREGIACLLGREADLKVVGQFASPSDALPALDGSDPNVILLDVESGSDKALDFVTRSRRMGFDGKILIVTAGVSDSQAIQLVQAGVAGILHKRNSIEVLCETIRKVVTGEACLENQYLAPLFRSMDRIRQTNQPAMTDRDRTVLRLVLQGLSNREIGNRLEVTEGAVKAYLRQLFGKLRVHTRAQLVKVAMDQYRDQLER